MHTKDRTNSTVSSFLATSMRPVRIWRRFTRPSRAFIASGIALALMAATGLEGAAAEQPQIGPQALQQIQALLAEKAAWTPVQRKISSRLLYAMKMRRGEPIAKGIPTFRTSVEVNSAGTTLVDIKAEVTEVLLAHIEALGGTIVSSFAQYQAIRAHLPLDQVEALAGLPEVIFIRPADEAMLNSHDPGAVNVSEGRVAHLVDLATGVDGTGINIGVLSDGVDTLAARQASGDLPATVTVLPGQAGSGDEGTAMLEIVHDLAPGAALFFATAFGSQASFAQNILDLQAAGANVIVDDVFFFAEHAFQDGIIAQAVETVSAAGALYFSSAGNSGNLNDGTSGVWEGDFVPTPGPPVLGGPPPFLVQDFGGGNNSNQITANTGPVALKWSDEAGASANDYDLCVLSSDLATIFECSANFQTGTQDPFEIISPAFVNERLVVIQFSGADRFVRLNSNRGRLQFNTAGQTSGHAAAENGFGVAAVDVATAGGGQFTGGPANPVETFSSDGPRRIFFDANGTPKTPGNFSSTGGIVRQKPDIAAADGVSTATPGFNPFFGTSAAAPHAAAIAALVLESATSPTPPQLRNALTPGQVRNALLLTALDIEAAGVDRDSGSGIADALAAVGALKLSLTTNATTFATGNTLTVDVNLDDPGIASTVDFLFGALLPDGDTVVFFTDLAFTTGVGSLANPSTLQPIVAGFDLTAPFTFNQPGFFTFTWTGAEAAGTYILFLAAVLAGAFGDNSIDPGDILMVDTVGLVFTP